MQWTRGIALIAVLAGCSAPPPGTTAVTMPSVEGRLPASAAPMPGKALPAEEGGRPPLPPAGSSEADAGRETQARPPGAGPIEAADGVKIVAVVPVQCPAAGGQPFARWLASAGVVDGRLADAGVDPAGREAVARLVVDWAGGERLLLVHGGMMPNPGHRLVIDSITRPRAEVLQVRGHRVAPQPGTIQPQVIAHPCQVVQLVDPQAARHGEIEFSLLR